jgi:hypothetical protein
MPRRQSLRRRLEALADEFEPVLQRAFLEAVADLRNNAQVGVIVERLERGDINGAIRALNVDPAAFRAFEESIRQAYIGGGTAATGSLPIVRGADGAAIVWRFDVRHPTGEAFLRNLSGTRITRMTDDMLLAARNVLSDGLAEGVNPRALTRRLVGVYDPRRRERVVGILGLTSTQERAVDRARRSLLAGDRAFITEFLSRKTLDRGPGGVFDRWALEALRGERTLSQADVGRMMRGYSSKLLRVRSETVARTEILSALNTSAKNAADQLIDATGVARQNVRKIWRTARDERVRSSHAALEGESVGIDEAFPNGLLYPGDMSGDPSEVIGCRCIAEYRVDHLANVE